MLPQVDSTLQIHCLLSGGENPKPRIGVEPSNDLAGGKGFHHQRRPATPMI
jgi:hypothetical protein